MVFVVPEAFGPFFRKYAFIAFCVTAGMLDERLPRVVSVKQTTLNGEGTKPSSFFASVALEARTLWADHEFRLLLLWAVVSPFAALAYLVWKKYDALKWLALPLLLIGLVHFAYQWAGAYATLHQYFRGW